MQQPAPTPEQIHSAQCIAVLWFVYTVPIEVLRSRDPYVLVCGLGFRGLLDSPAHVPFALGVLPQAPTLLRCLQCGEVYANACGTPKPFMYACSKCDPTQYGPTARNYYLLDRLCSGVLPQ